MTDDSSLLRDRNDSETPLTDLQLQMSHAVDKARALPQGSVGDHYEYLIRIYWTQIIEAVEGAR